MYLRCLSQAPWTPSSDIVPKYHSELLTKYWSCGGTSIRSLAKLYNSIPSYRDVHNLSGEEFYSTLNNLKSTYQELKFKINCLSFENSGNTSTTSPSLASSNSQLDKNSEKKCKTSKKKKKSVPNKKFGNTLELHTFKPLRSNCHYLEKHNNQTKGNTASKRINLDQEIEDFKKSLQDYEQEFKRPLTSLTYNKSACRSPKQSVNTTQNDSNKLTEKVPVENTFLSKEHRLLRKSLSFNDLHSIAPSSARLTELENKNKILKLLSFKAENNTVKGYKKLSNYCEESPNTKELSKIIIDSPAVEKYYADRLQTKNSCGKEKTYKNGKHKMAFNVFNLDKKCSTPSPIHPVARPNIAATLRAESSKKKVNELKDNCINRNTTPQFDWEVRKTPAWKMLSLNESHKEILQLRLATRKVEQALEQREHELNMKLMRQRVKSAPLLLEGDTYRGSRIVKPSHACQNAGKSHIYKSCKESSSCSHSCTCRTRFNISAALHHENCDNCTKMSKKQEDLFPDKSTKLNTLRKIYDNPNRRKPQSHNLNLGTNTEFFKSQRKKKQKADKKKNKKPYKDDIQCLTVDMESGEELSSLDRAFL